MPTIASLSRALRATPLRQCCACAMLVGFLAAIVGVPVYPAPSSSSGKRFPCDGKHCGCDQAGGCWQSCCCMTLAERIAWARENNVPVPASARERLAQEQAAEKSCCTAKGKCPVKASGSPGPRERGVSLIPALAALKCRGLSLGLSSLGLPLTFPPESLRFEVHPPWQDSLRDCAPSIYAVIYDVPTPYG